MLSGIPRLHKENQGIHIKPNQKHKLFNKSQKNLEFIVVSEPKSHGDRVNLTE